MKSILQVLCLIVLASHDLCGQFEVCNSSTKNSLYDIYFINQNIGLAVGDSGTIVKSIDGGLNWKVVMSNDTVYFRKVKFFDAENGIAVGSDIYLTNDAGQTWQFKSTDNDYLIDLSIVTDSTAIVSGYPNKIIKTNDKGQSWDVIVGNNPMLDIAYISYLDENIGYSICCPNGHEVSATFKTTDGGNTWTEIIAQSGFEFTILEDLTFISEDIGFRGGWYNPHFKRTIDGGVNWESVNFYTTPNWEQSIYDFHIEKDLPNAYYACGWYGKIFKSEDGGANWKELESGLTHSASLHGIYFLNDTTGWAVGSNGVILKTTNGGETVGAFNHAMAPRFKLFPNPTNNYIYIENSGDYEIEEIMLADYNGQIILSSEPVERINLTDLSSGIYNVIIRTNDDTYIEKIIKM